MTTISTGQSASNLVVSQGNPLGVLAGGSAVSTTVASGGSEYVSAGGLDDNVRISAGGVYVATGAGAVGRWGYVLAGGAQSVGGGGLVSGGFVFGQETVLAGGIASNVYLSGGTMNVSAGGSARATSVFSAGTLFVLSGGTALATTVSAGGTISVSGGLASGLTIDSGAVAYVRLGGVVSSMALGAYTNAFVSGGAAYATQVGSAGALYVSGGSLDVTVIAAHGYQEVDAGAVASGTTVAASGRNVVSFGGTAEATTLNGGRETVLGSGLASGTVINSGGRQRISAGGIASATRIGSAGVEVVLSGGTALSTTVSGGGLLAVLVGGSAGATTPVGGGLVSSGAVLLDAPAGVSVWAASASGVAVGSGGLLYVATGGLATSATLLRASAQVQGGITVGMQVSGGAEVVSHGGLASSTVLGSGGGLYVLSGGQASLTLVNSGAVAFVSAGGVAVGTTVAGGGSVDVAGSGLASGTTLAAGGFQQIDAGGSASGAVLTSGGTQDVLAGGLAIGTQASGGTEIVFAAGVASAATLFAGGAELVSAGGFVYAPVIGSSGRLVLGSGAVAGGGIVFSGGAAVLTISDTTLPGTTISGFTIGDTIDLAGISGASATLNSTTDLLTISAGGTMQTLQLAGNYSGHAFAVTGDGASGSLVTEMPCYAAGTHIATTRGEVPVEDLVLGDTVLTQAGRLAPVRWIGRRVVDCRRHARPENVLPVRIAADAFAPGQPRRDLLLSPDHAVFFGGALIPVRYLVNGCTVAPLLVATMTYLHVELDRHDVILAEGLPAESFLDTGNRAAFGDGPTLDLHPDFARGVWNAEGCAELVVAGSRLVEARRHLLSRAVAIGHHTTEDPGIAVLAAGRRLAATVEGTCWRLPLPEGLATVTLRSRAWTPAHLDPAAHDTRVLGVALARLALDGRDMALDAPELAAGWHLAEPHWRWTDGAATIPVTGVRALAFTVGISGRYWLAPNPAADRRPSSGNGDSGDGAARYRVSAKPSPWSARHGRAVPA